MTAGQQTAHRQEPNRLSAQRLAGLGCDPSSWWRRLSFVVAWVGQRRSQQSLEPSLAHKQGRSGRAQPLPLAPSSSTRRACLPAVHVQSPHPHHFLRLSPTSHRHIPFLHRHRQFHSFIDTDRQQRNAYSGRPLVHPPLARRPPTSPPDRLGHGCSCCKSALLQTATELPRRNRGTIKLDPPATGKILVTPTPAEPAEPTPAYPLLPSLSDCRGPSQFINHCPTSAAHTCFLLLLCTRHPLHKHASSQPLLLASCRSTLHH